MADSIRIKLDTSKYVIPTQDDITAAKRFVLQREEYARLLQGRIDEILSDAAEKVVKICYRYDIDPKDIYFSSAFNEKMMDEISDVMNQADEEILDLIFEYSTRVTNDKDRISALLLWMATLGRGNRNLQDTLDGYLYKTMKDWEAAIAALRSANVPMADAVTKIKTYLHTIYTMPEVLAAFRKSSEFTATYIRSKGVQQGGVGLSNNGSTNVTNMARITLQMVWMRSLRMDYKRDGATGYYVLRGSSYLCDLCDSACGFHTINDLSGFPPQHPHCQCYAIPIFTKDFGNLSHEITDYQ